MDRAKREPRLMPRYALTEMGWTVEWYRNNGYL